MTLSMVVAATTTGWLVSRTGRVTIFPVTGLSVATASLLLLAAMIDVAPTALVLALTALVGAGLGMVMPATQVTVQQAAGRQWLGSAIGSLSLCRSIGGAIGVAVIGAIVFLSMGQSDHALATTLERVIETGPEYLSQLPVADRAALAAHLDHVFRIVFLSTAVFSGIGALIATTVPKPEF